MSNELSSITGMPLGEVFRACLRGAVVECVDKEFWQQRLDFEDMLNRISPRRHRLAWFDPDRMQWIAPPACMEDL